MKDFSKNILHTIEHDHIEPRPRWVFLARQGALLTGFILSVFIGGGAVATILFSLTSADWDTPRMMQAHPGPFLFAYLPYVWVIFMILFGIAAYYEIRYTKGGYRYRGATILGVSFIASLFVGGLLHSVGAGQMIDRRFSEAVPQYRGFDARRAALWTRPQDGMLAGRVLSTSATTTLVLEDFERVQWTVDMTEVSNYTASDFQPGQRVRIAGLLVKPSMFRATEILPWMRGGMMRGEGFLGATTTNGRGPATGSGQGMMGR